MEVTKHERLAQQESSQRQKMENYYRFQAKIYDSTRWTFLFGRSGLIRLIPDLQEGSTILEVGCGTGYNLIRLAKKFPNCTIYGLDTSETMIEKSRKKTAQLPNVRLLHEPYGIPSSKRPEKADIIVFSYSLSMINPQWPALIDSALHDLKPGGYLAVVDFEYSRFRWFRWHMGNNHVRMEKHLLPYLNERFQTENKFSKAAYGGIWYYFAYIGRKN